MSGRKANSISKDFPLYHSDLVPVFESDKIIPKGKKIIPKNLYTNEHPDFFKLDCMIEKGYNNPYLTEVLKVDRGEELKKMEKNVDCLNVINFLKNNRKFSQNPKLLKYIQNQFDVDMYNKRQRIKEEKKNKTMDNKGYLFTDPNDPDYENIVKKLNYFSPKLHYQNKKYLDLKDNISIGNYSVSKDNFDKIKKITCEIEPLKSSYLGNYNEYQISEAQNRNKKKEFLHMRRTFMKTNIINGMKEEINLPPVKNDRWGSFYENFILLMKNKSGLKKKGGLFTEFSNRNITSIIVNKNDIRERLKREREKKLKLYESIKIGLNKKKKK